MGSHSTQPEIIFARLPYRSDDISTLVGLSQDVARWNGNTTWQRPLRLITDDLDLAITESRDPIRADQYLGMNWPGSGVIWINGERRSRESTTRTLAHEMAHQLTRGAHGYTWRRMYVMLAPLWWRVLCRPWFLSDLNVSAEAQRTVVRYRRATGLLHGEFRDRVSSETVKHAQAAQRAWNRWAGELRRSPTMNQSAVQPHPVILDEAYGIPPAPSQLHPTP